MAQFVPSERATPIREPSTANLLVNSEDRNRAIYSSAADFQIQSANSILNGYFTRVGVTEVVLDWFSPNISPDITNPDLLTISFPPGTDSISFQAPSAFFTEAQLIQWVLGVLNEATSPTVTWTLLTDFTTPAVTGARVLIVPSDPLVALGFSGSIAGKLSFISDVRTVGSGISIGNADLRRFSFIDIVSSQLTYNQSLKDASTSKIIRDVLVRWYFAFDQAPTYDELGFPILMGYTPFCLRRIFSPPKQIKWEGNQPIGNLSFQAYDPQGNPVYMNATPTGPPSEYQMTLQVSEV